MDLFEEMKKEKKSDERNYIARKILKIAAGADDLVEPTVQAIKKEKNDTVKYSLLNILSKIGTDSAIDGIIKMTKDKSDYIVKASLAFLNDFKTPAISQALREIILTTKNETHLRDALYGFYYYIVGSEAEANLDLIIDVMKNNNFKFLLNYISRLGELSKKMYSEKILTALEDISQKHKNPEFRLKATETIDKISTEILIKIGNNECEIEKNGRLVVPSLMDGDLSKVDWGEHASKVKELRIQYSYLKSLSGIGVLSELKTLGLEMSLMEGGQMVHQKTILEDISALSNCPNLLNVDFPMGKISNLDGLANHPNLGIINLSGNEIEKIEGLTNLPKLFSLNLSNNKIKQISGLDDLPSLNHLDLSYNEFTQIKGLQNLKRLITINLGNNSYLPKKNVTDAQKLVAKCAGVSLGPEEPKDLSKPNIHPLKHILLEENVEDKCLYCKNPVPSGGNQQVKCEKELQKIVFLSNSKIPNSITEYNDVVAPQSRMVTGYKSTPNSYESFTTKTVSMRGTSKKTKRKIGNLNGKVFLSLAGTVCKACSENFLESVDKILKKITRKGSADAIDKSISYVEDRYYSNIKYWMKKI